MEKIIMERELVSVIIPAYNAGPYIAATVRSVLEQTYRPIEVIVVNDGSTDDTAGIIDELSQAGDLIRVINMENRGASAARNAGFRVARGGLIKFLDGDDLINPVMIEEQVKLAERHRHSVITCRWGRFSNDEHGALRMANEDCWRTLPPDEWLCSSWKDGRPMTNPGLFLIPKKIADIAGNWDERLSLLDDTEYFTRIVLASEQVVFCSEAILSYRSGVPGSLSGKNSRAAFLSAFRAIEKTTTAFSGRCPSPEVRRTCANIWQSFIYWVYPAHPDLIAAAGKQRAKYGSATLAYPASGYLLLLQRFLGWKLIKKIKIWFHQ
ncbi:glycosyltransferase family 2 protein [Mucilaginibacter ginsenosidivorans]|uniref:Glycosyltransferase family 2 protein n=1 Tax=Mucilaginibacter ginsenosidivorans TaxID=398053 RepID=A0A5B8UUK6_9SPHI|nr:glycosyltransferase [Mucilaginibacter ginsenosidivorans]QEC62568.1 glycosyltransferase family 2 protein [Mucilaginibacter ginsenosidivorans]